MTPYRQVRATFDDSTIRVYQAYSHEIADAALAAGTFAPPFKRGRMTWIKPSYRWVLYRSRWAAKDPGQHRILAVDITRDGFAWALRHACLSDLAQQLGPVEARAVLDAHPVRVQWDPERDLRFQPLDHRSIQIGLTREAVDRYVDDWIVRITDVTDLAHQIGSLVAEGDLDAAGSLLPPERPYPLSPDLAEHLNADQEPLA